MVDTPLDHFMENGLIYLSQQISLLQRLDKVLGTYVRNRNGLDHGLFANVFHHILDKHRTLSNITI